eukprot:g17474.t1
MKIRTKIKMKIKMKIKTKIKLDRNVGGDKNGYGNKGGNNYNGGYRGGNGKRGGPYENRKGKGKADLPYDVTLSRTLTSILRHANVFGSVQQWIVEELLKDNGEGWMLISTVEEITHRSKEAMLLCVEHNGKGRFQTDVPHDLKNSKWIRATNGHTVPGVSPGQKRAGSLEELAGALEEAGVPSNGPYMHGTNPCNVDSILEHGLWADRNQVHVTTAPHHLRGSGRVDIAVGEMIRDGVPVFVSPNGVILVDEWIPAKYIMVLILFFT